MHKIVLYCKSYDKDVYRAKTLLDSIIKFNIDNIPFYISVPKKDIELFRNILGNEHYILLDDESIDSENSGWIGQQIIKSQFWKLGLCKNYICIDSDCSFQLVSQHRYWCWWDYFVPQLLARMTCHCNQPSCRPVELVHCSGMIVFLLLGLYLDF